MNGQHRPIETDPLGAIRKELLSAAWRKKARRDRNRRFATVTAMLALLLASVTGGASALGVDLPVVGDALNRLVSNREGTTDVGGGSFPSQIKPGPGNSSEEVRIPWDDGTTSVGTAFLNRRDQICLLIAEADHEVGVPDCQAPGAITQRVDDGVVYLTAVQVSSTTVVAGYAAPEVESLDVRGPSGPIETALSGVWTPRARGGSPLRVFFASAPMASTGGHIDARAAALARDLRAYEVQAQLVDGRTITARP